MEKTQTQNFTTSEINVAGVEKDTIEYILLNTGNLGKVLITRPQLIKANETYRLNNK